jgi:hypothetical protein
MFASEIPVGTIFSATKVSGTTCHPNQLWLRIDSNRFGDGIVSITHHHARRDTIYGWNANLPCRTTVEGFQKVELIPNEEEE